MSDVTAEKAWDEWSPRVTDLSKLAPTYYEVFMAGRASRDAEVAELQKIIDGTTAHHSFIVSEDDKLERSLREQLAEANERLRIVEAENDDCSETIMSQSRKLAEAQATIEKAPHDEDCAINDWYEWWEGVAPDPVCTCWKSAPSSTGGNDSQGVALIAAERKRQVTEEGYDAEHDKAHESELARGASSYALAGADDLNGLDYVANDSFDPPADWPWRTSDWKPTGEAIPDLVKAGGLIAAALDSLIAEGGNDHE